VVQPGERNAIDQQIVEQELWQEHGIKVIRRTLLQVEQEGSLVGRKRRLLLNDIEVSVIYFRAGYTPDDYLSSREWSARFLLERSFAIKCPSVTYHLAGAKKVQQQLCSPGELERFVTKEEAASLRQVFAGLWSLDGSDVPPKDATADEIAAASAMENAKRFPESFVMKPQREGGGHNLFGDELAAALKSWSRPQRSGFILMQRIFPKAAPAILVRNGALIRGNAISEFGVYSTFLRARSGRIAINEAVGHLVRTKPVGVDEGGVAAGFAVLSSPLVTNLDKM